MNKIAPFAVWLRYRLFNLRFHTILAYVIVVPFLISAVAANKTGDSYRVYQERQAERIQLRKQTETMVETNRKTEKETIEKINNAEIRSWYERKEAERLKWLEENGHKGLAL